jgi:hypothetical protein
VDAVANAPAPLKLGDVPQLGRGQHQCRLRRGVLAPDHLRLQFVEDIALGHDILGDLLGVLHGVSSRIGSDRLLGVDGLSILRVWHP